MATGGAKKRFGALAMEKGFVDLDQVIEAIVIQARENVEREIWSPIGEILLQLGYMDSQQIKEVLEAKFERRFGDVAISKGFITLEQLIDAMTVQVKDEATKGIHRLLGEILIEMDVLNVSQVEKILDGMRNTTEDLNK
jgi:hypothetical protein